MSGPKGRPSPGRKGVVAGRGPPRVVAAVPVRGAPGRRRGPGGGTRPAFDDNTVWRPNATVNVHQAPSGRIVRTVVPVTGGAVPSAMTTSGPTSVAVFNLAADIIEPELKTLFFKFGANKVLVDYDPQNGAVPRVRDDLLRPDGRRQGVGDGVQPANHRRTPHRSHDCGGARWSGKWGDLEPPGGPGGAAPGGGGRGDRE